MISIIVVVGRNREIGCENKLLWNLPKDMKRFKEITIGHTVVMGDKTFESIGKPLPNRKNVILSLDENYTVEGCEVRNSLEDVLKEAKESKEEIFVIGGGTIYNLSLPFADKLYLTVVDDQPKADTFFPDYSEFKEIVRREEGDDNGFKYEFLELIR
ncbi:dihydrofolate reductase [bacterium]|jgi:dihydrofolate reductase|nr:dihydrofolate reductase [bacterium]MBT4251020.1 dihydrofolate reductase [bacterium]MBT4597748.1 dihydrofolate reductase [bacterium]MBT6753843.1 dihydrofolate reductase [bacterium]MBT7037445.1 dihydrofolate reductase [bacterium]